MNPSSLLKTFTMPLFLSISTIAAPIAMTQISADYANMKIIYTGDGTQQLSIISTSIVDTLNASGIISAGSGEGNFSQISSSSQAFAHTSLNDNNYHYSNAFDDHGYALSLISLTGNFNASNLQSITLEYDLTEYMKLSTDKIGDTAYGYVESYAFLSSPNPDFGFLDSSFQFIEDWAINGGDLELDMSKHVVLHHTFDSPYSGPLSFLGLTFASAGVATTAVPENTVLPMISFGLLSITGMAFYNRKKSIFQI